MRSISTSLLEKIQKANQTLYEDADPRMKVLIQRAKTTLSDTDLFYVETIRSKTGLGDIGVALYRPDPNSAPTFVYEIHNDNGIISTCKRDLSDFKPDRWKYQFTVGSGKVCSIEFDGHWVKDSEARYCLVTEEKPYIFWTDNSNNLYVQKWDDTSSKVFIATDVTKVATIRGWKDAQGSTVDQGLICTYIKSDGNVYYRNYCLQEDGSYTWETEKQITEFTNIQNIGLFRTNDYRIGFEVESNGNISWLLTKRSYSGMSVEPEYVTGNVVSAQASMTPIKYTDINMEDEYTNAQPKRLVFLLGTGSETYSLSSTGFVNDSTIFMEWSNDLIAQEDLTPYFTISTGTIANVAIDSENPKRLIITLAASIKSYISPTVTYNGQAELKIQITPIWMPYLNTFTLDITAVPPEDVEYVTGQVNITTLVAKFVTYSTLDTVNHGATTGQPISINITSTKVADNPI